LWFFGDENFERAGGGIIPCKKCGAKFQSYNHFDYYDPFCEWCSFENRKPKEVKRVLQEILKAFDEHKIDWETTKGYLVLEGIRVLSRTSQRHKDKRYAGQVIRQFCKRCGIPVPDEWGDSFCEYCQKEMQTAYRR